ncbi:phosphatidate cytidylyltransferase [Okibacterium sp. HSC-33S16]|uniref:phosphatidate cytidylyltransferase n=1 Tax=Okibacterium sp. HSC-33S16 TaxID=2910965 RepID=UPI0020A05F47|nr:phosphatidate cytidylyltransferase [Okibacterium sp. HSC-33S16]MCP2030579.1 phosphatidate cytidylyltransferase [Okibacterium sp. HSC-33S16]
MTEPAEKPGRNSQRSKRMSRDELQAQLKSRRAEIERQVRTTRAQIDQVNERIEARAGRNLLMATVFGLGLGLILVASLIFIKGIFVAFCAAIVAFATFELARALRESGRRVDVIPAVVAGVAIVGGSYLFSPSSRWIVLAAAVVFVVLWRLVAQLFESRSGGRHRLGRDLVAAVLVQLYVPFLASFAVTLVLQPEGQWWALAFLILVVAVDIGAYASGLSFGKHPMAPKISPKKTWEGFAGAGVAAVVTGVVLALLMLDTPWWVGVIFGLALLGTATLGDLTESLIKRDIGIKDISSWLPGHGGFLDRIDSMLPSAPVALAIFTVFSATGMTA